MQELYFGRVSRGGTLCEPTVFIFVTEKEQNFQKNETIALRHLKSKKNQIYLNSHRYFVVYFLYCRNTSNQKSNASVPSLLLSPSQPLSDLVTQRPLFPVGERACCVTWPNNDCVRDYAYCRSSYRKKIKIIRRHLVAPKMWFHVILLRKANWNSVVSPLDPKQGYLAISE